MSTASDFIDTFSDYLANSKRLPLEVAAPFTIREPTIGRDRAQSRVVGGGALRFMIDVDGEPYGSIAVAPQKLAKRGYDSLLPDKEKLLITYLDTTSYREEGQQKGAGYGREMLRRAVLYADQHGYTKVATTGFLNGAASFWLGMGFKYDATAYVEPFRQIAVDWNAVPKSESAPWQDKVGASPCALWDLARTEVGRRVLDQSCGKGVLNLRDDIQRQYAFTRLHLDHS